MGFKILPDGTIEADSPEEALAVSALMRKQTEPKTEEQRPTSKRPKTHNGTVSMSQWREFIDPLTKDQRAALRAIKEAATNGIPMTDLAVKLGLKSTNAASGVVGGGLRKNLRKHRLDNDQVIKARVVEGLKRYFPGPLLMENDP